MDKLRITTVYEARPKTVTRSGGQGTFCFAVTPFENGERTHTQLERSDTREAAEERRAAFIRTFEGRVPLVLA